MQPHTVRLARLALTAAASLAAMAAQATVLPYKNLQALVDEAEGIVMGTVRSVEATAAKPHDVNTFVTLDQLEMINGKADGATLTLRLKGGLVDGRGLHVDGAPQFKPNERVLLFVQGNGRDLVPLVGWSQGMFRLVPDANSGKTQVQDAEGNDIVGMSEGHLQRRDGAELEVHLMGAPEMQLARQPKPEASAGMTDDGSETTVVDVQALPARAMTADRFVGELRQRAAGHAGKRLRSVLPGTAAEAAEQADLAPAANRPATQPVALPEGDGVSLPMLRMNPAPADAR